MISKIVKNTQNFIQILQIFLKNINVIFSTVSLFHSVQNWNRKNFKGYFEIFIKSDVKKIIKLNKKKFYKNKRNLVGVNLNAEFPKKPDLTIINSFNQNINDLSNDILKYIFKRLR